MKLALLRHGEAEASEKRLYCGSTDLPLSEKGREKLEAARGAYPDVSSMRVITSGMRRCEETLRIIYGDIPHERIKDLREVDFGAFEMRSYEELKSDPAYVSWITGDNEKNVPPFGESGEHMKKRVLKALSAILRGGRDALVVTHGGSAAVILEALFPEKGQNRYELQPPPGGGYLIDVDAHTLEKI